MSNPAFGPPPPSAWARPSAPPRPLLDSAAVVLLSLSVALLVGGAVLGLRGSAVLGGDSGLTTLCRNGEVTVGECLLATQIRFAGAHDLLTLSSASLATGGILFAAGTWRLIVATRLRARRTG